jgi:hypothetical protein
MNEIPEWQPIEEKPLIPKAVWYVAPVLLIGAAGGYYYYTKHKTEPPVEAESVTLPPPAEVAPEPEIKHPVAVQPAEKPLPALNESDTAFRTALAPLADPKNLERFLVNENVIRNIVVTVDNLARAKAAAERRPVRPTPGTIEIAKEGDEMWISEASFARYAPFVKLVLTTDTTQLADVYLHYYPLFQQAYESLGNPDTYFNDRLVEVIDHLLETPIPDGPIRLTQPNVFYEYADPQLEARSAGQKLLLRMGTANASQLKTKLRDFRTLIIGGGKPSAATVTPTDPSTPTTDPPPTNPAQ